MASANRESSVPDSSGPGVPGPRPSGHVVSRRAPPRLDGVGISAREWSIVCAGGAIDAVTAVELDRALLAAVTAEQPHRHLILDLDAVTFFGYSGLPPLIRARRRLPDRFWLAHPSRPVLRLLDLAGLTKDFAFLHGLPGPHHPSGP